MTTQLTRQAAVLFKLESTEGVDASPSAGSDGILVESPVISFSGVNITDTNEVTPSLDPFDKIVGGMPVSFSFDMYLKGCGTPANAPEWGKVLKACGFAETLTSSPIPASPEALAAGASQVQATLGASATGTAQLYRGMPVNFTSTVVGTSFIYDYSAAKLAKLTDTLSANLAASSNYQIPNNALYMPASSSISSATIYFYRGGTLYIILGCRGSVSFALQSGGPGKMSFKFMGQFGSKTDSALPTVTYDATRPPVWKGGAFTIGSLACAVSALSLDMGGKLAQPDDPNATEGFSPAVITARAPQGTMSPKETLVATRDVMGDFRAQTKRPIHARFGSAAGNRVALTIPSGLYLGQEPGDQNGYVKVDVPFHATGQDAGVALCSW